MEDDNLKNLKKLEEENPQRNSHERNCVEHNCNMLFTVPVDLGPATLEGDPQVSLQSHCRYCYTSRLVMAQRRDHAKDQSLTPGFFEKLFKKISQRQIVRD